MRIISGKYKGKRLSAPAKLPVRPTTDFAKEALFNILNNHFYFDAVSVLELFAGSGNISYEFASRGCNAITCVDAHYGCVKYINQTAEALQFPIKAIKSDVFKFLENTTQQADIIFADPFYNFTDAQFARIAELIFDNTILLPGGVLIIEHSKHTALDTIPYFSYNKKYGGSVFSFFEWEMKLE